MVRSPPRTHSHDRACGETAVCSIWASRRRTGSTSCPVTGGASSLWSELHKPGAADRIVRTGGVVSRETPAGWTGWRGVMIAATSRVQLHVRRALLCEREGIRPFPAIRGAEQEQMRRSRCALRLLFHVKHHRPSDEGALRCWSPVPSLARRSRDGIAMICGRRDEKRAACGDKARRNPRQL